MGHDICVSGRATAQKVPQLASIYCNASNRSAQSNDNNLVSLKSNLVAAATPKHLTENANIPARLKRNELEQATRKLWRKADAVCFDVDSTVCQDEAIDELAHFLGKGREVSLCTQKAMSGNMTFREALALRLNLMRPSRQQLEQYVKSAHSIRLTPGIVELVAELRKRNIDVYLVSGGFRCIIKPVAELLNIHPTKNVFANEILFDENGNYAGFDENELTSDSGSENVGKAGVCGLLKTRHAYKTLIMVGDGATDAEACPPADAFIGFGGNQVRETVKKLSDWYVHDFNTMLEELTKAEASE